VGAKGVKGRPMTQNSSHFSVAPGVVEWISLCREYSLPSPSLVGRLHSTPDSEDHVWSMHADEPTADEHSEIDGTGQKLSRTRKKQSELRLLGRKEDTCPAGKTLRVCAHTANPHRSIAQATSNGNMPALDDPFPSSWFFHLTRSVTSNPKERKAKPNRQ